ncbi:MAG: hypothetical protein ACOCWG_03845 [bacterium]
MKKKDWINFIQITGSIFSITGVSLLWIKDNIDWTILISIFLEACVGLSILSFIWALTQQYLHENKYKIKPEIRLPVKIIQILILAILILLYYWLTKNWIHDFLINILRNA